MPKETFRWLHLSDFHVGMEEYAQRRLFAYILEHVKARVAAGLGPHAVFVTGDVANKGLEAEYSEFCDGFLWPLIEILPGTVSTRVFVVPGNHDVDRLKVRAVNTYDIQRRVPEFLDPTEQGAHERSVLLPRFQAFADGDITGTTPHWLSGQHGTLRQKLEIGARKIAIVGTNTSWFSAGNDDRHRLSPGKALLELALADPDSADLKIVLGHHPLDWFADSDVGPIKSLLGQYRAVYLCGHLHRPLSVRQEVSSGALLTLQAGASFQSREDELWVNRILWCEVDFDSQEVSLEPLSWSRENQEWALDGAAFAERYRRADRWHIPLPRHLSPNDVGPKPVSRSAKTNAIRRGWVIVDADYLKEHRVAPTEKQAISYFDGRTPNWTDIASELMPQREVVRRMVQLLGEPRSGNKPYVVLFTGAAGEGKSTALLQVACALVQSDSSWRVLWHSDPGTPLPENLVSVLSTRSRWLIVSDDAEIVCQRVFEATRELAGTPDFEVHFLLCARDTDWKASHGDSLPWSNYSMLVTERLRGLSQYDASEIVKTWAAHGTGGLGNLAGMPLETATTELVHAARSEIESGHEGSLFGALLHVRVGGHLHEHVETLLSRLVAYKSRTFDLQHALALIAAPHSQGLPILTKEVLAKALNLAPSELLARVLGPLGDEAAIATTGRHVFTRHRAIAAALVDVLVKKFSVDMDEIFLKLHSAALALGLSGVFVQNFDQWRFLGDHFFSKGDAALGIQLGRQAIGAEPGNPFLVANLSKMYRESGQPESAVALFRERLPERPTRSFFFEWGLAEATSDDVALGAWMVGYSLSDQCAAQAPDLGQAAIGLNGLSDMMLKLFEKYGNEVFKTAEESAVQMRDAIRAIQDRVHRRNRSAGPSKSWEFRTIQHALNAAYEQRSHEVEINGADLSFRHLHYILG